MQAVSLQMTLLVNPQHLLPLLSVRPIHTFPAAVHHCTLASTKLYCLLTEVRIYEQLIQSRYRKVEQLEMNLRLLVVLARK